MNDTNKTNSQDTATPVTGFSPWQMLKSKRISYLTLPLLFMATVTEFVILATGWKYQQVVCVPKGMGVTFFGIGPIGATILAVELLKLPLAIWTASRQGWQKSVMIAIGLPMICVLTFQLVKDMAVYEMGVAMTPASQWLEKASAEEIKISQLKGELAGIEEKKSDREHKLAELAANKSKAKAELDEELKRNDAMRQDAISLTEYQQKELSEVEARQAAIVRQFNNDTVPLVKALDDLRTRRESEFPLASKWNAEEARIENSYKTKLADYTNKKAAYEKNKVEYASANFLKRQLMGKPVDPGVPPEREVNTILKPSFAVEIDAQIKAKEAELLAVNNKRRDRLAEVSDDARRVKEEFNHRSTAKRDETDRHREELLAAQAQLVAEWKAEQKQIDTDLATAVQKVDGIRAELDTTRKTAEGYYEQREAAIRSTQVHRIATTVEIVRGLLMGERPVSIKASAKERGDLLTDQISMVRIWVYPLLAFIVAFLPTLMVEIGFSTLFHPEEKQPAYRLGFFGRRLHWLYTRAGAQKIYRAERKTRDAVAEIVLRDKALAAANLAVQKAEKDKNTEVQAAYEANIVAAAAHEEQLQKQETKWTAKHTEVTNALEQAVAEKAALRDFQQAEIERQVQARQTTWSERLTQVRQELDAQRAASDAERATMSQEHHQKLVEVSNDWRNQVTQARRQLADAELAAEEKTAKLEFELKEAVAARDTLSSQLQIESEALALKLTQAKQDAARELEKATRQEKQNLERQQTEFAKTTRQAQAEFERQLKQREHELSMQSDTHVVQEVAKAEQEARRREQEYSTQLDARIREVDARWKQALQEREEGVQIRLKQQEQQVLAAAEVRLREAQTEAGEQLRRRELEFERQLEAQAREAETGLREELQQQELAFHAKLKQREQALHTKAVARETELQSQAAADLRNREEAWSQQAESRIRANETRLTNEAQQREEGFQLRLRQREHQMQLQAEARQAELQVQYDQELRRRDLEASEGRKREQALVSKMNQQVEAHEQAERGWQAELEAARASIEPLKALLVRTELECDLDRQSASAGIRQVQELKKKLDEATSVLNGSKNGKSFISNQG